MSDLSNVDLGQYHLLEVIRHGGMATVYKAYQASLDRYVAVKVLANSPDPQFATRFKREARAIAQLQHPNILPIYDYGEQDGLLYLVVQYIENGTTLGDLLGTPMEPVGALRIIERVLSALDYAHQRGIIHRDIKPSNILMPSPTWPLLADFGIAKIMNASDGQHLTMSGVFIGTPAYVAPEQVLGNAIDVRTDLYSMGVVLYEMVTGRVPFDANTPMTMLTKHAYEPPPSPRTINPDLPPVVEPVLLRALAKDPADRYQSATTMAEALARVAVQIEQGRSHDQHAALYQAGLHAFEEGRWDLAVERLRELVALAPGYEDAADLLVAAQDAQVRTKTEARLQLERVQQRRQGGQPSPGTIAPGAPLSGEADPAPATIVPALPAAPSGTGTLPTPLVAETPVVAAGVGAAPAAAVRVAPQPTARRSIPWLAGVILAVLVLGGGLALGLSGVLGGTGLGGVGPPASPTPGDGMEMGVDAASLGTLRFSDGSATLDEVTLSVEKLSAPAAGTQYEAWLLGQGGELRQSLSVLQLDGSGKGDLVYRDSQGRNLLSLFDRLEITIEPDPDPNPSSSRNIAYSGAVPPLALEHIKHLLVAFPTTDKQTALTIGLVEQATVLNDTAQAMLAAQKAGDLATMRRNAEGMVNLIAGPKGEHAGDLDGDGTATDPGDGFGLLLNGDQAGYIEGTLDHAQLSSDQPDATANIKLHAAHVKVAAENLSEWAVELRDRATRIAAAASVDAARDDATQAAALADRFLNGKDLDGNEVVDPLPGEAGAKTAYQHARYTADIAVLPAAASGAGGRRTGTPVPMEMGTPYIEEDEESPPPTSSGPAPPTDTVGLSPPTDTVPPPPPETATPPLPTATAPPPPTDTPLPPPPTATAVPPPPTATPNLVPIGSAHFHDGPQHQPLAAISGTLQLPAPPAGQAFYAWLVNSAGGAPVSLGRLTPDAQGQAAFAYADPTQANLLASYDTVLVSAEALETKPAAPSAVVAFRGQVPPLALEHIRHLLVGFDEVPDKAALAVRLYDQVGLLYHYAEAMNKAYGAGDFAGVKAAAEQAVHLIEGAHGPNAGDLDDDGTVGAGGDGFGLLPGDDQPGYLLEATDHAALAAAQPDATEAIKKHATGVAITADNVQGWVTPLRDRALAITGAADLKATIAPISDIMTLASNAYYGIGLEVDSQPQPVAGSGGAFTCYQEALAMADLPIK
jgi:hypothetical protein